jgi:hypothetical protein
VTLAELVHKLFGLPMPDDAVTVAGPSPEALANQRQVAELKARAARIQAEVEAQQAGSARTGRFRQ